MKKALVILIVLLGVFLAIGCTGNKPVTSNETGIPAETITKVAKETPVAEISPTEVTPTGETVTRRQNATGMQNETNTQSIKEFTPEELAQYNGKNGTSYVAYQGKVYDVSNSYLWKNGDHKGHRAGKDLTEELNRSSHGPRVIYGYPVVGTLKQ